MSLAIGVLGEGDSKRKTTVSLLQDHLASHPDAHFVLPGTAPMFTDAVRHAADFAFDNKIEMVFLLDAHDEADLADYGDVIKEQVEDLRGVLLEHVDHLLVAWDDTPDLETQVEAALKSGVKVYDLTDGLFEIRLEGDTTEDVPEPVAPADEAQTEVVPEPSREAVQPASQRLTNADIEDIVDRVWDRFVTRLLARP